MAILFRWTEEQQRDWDAWVASRPPHVRAVAERFQPNRLYCIKESGHRVTLVSFEEYTDGEVGLKVHVGGQFNFVTFERTVFGIRPDDLEECDLPGPEERLGAWLTEKEDVDDFIEASRDAVLGKVDEEPAETVGRFLGTRAERRRQERARKRGHERGH